MSMFWKSIFGDCNHRVGWSDILPNILISFASFCTLFFVVNTILKNKMKKFPYSVVCEHSNRILSIIHGICCTIIFLKVLFDTDSVHTMLPYYDYCLYLTLGYEFYDIVCLIYMDTLYKEDEKKDKQVSHSRIGLAIFFHHFFCIVSCLLYLRNGTKPMGSFLVAAMFFMEFSSIFMHIRWLLLTNSLKETTLFVINTLCLLVAFLITRIAIWPYLINKLATQLNTTHIDAFNSIPIECKVGISFLVVINFYWLGSLTYAFFKKREPKPMKPTGQQTEKKQM